MKKLLQIIILLSLAHAEGAFASKAVTTKKTVTLADGSTRTVSLRGDEHFSFFASSRGELVIRDGEGWRLATGEEESAARRRLNAVEEERRNARKTGESIIATRPFPCTGTPKALVILASFSDRDFEYAADDIEKLFNSDATDPSSGLHGYSSLARYMYECSGGLFRPEFDFKGPYKLDGTVADYGYNINGADANLAAFVKDACAAADADGTDFSEYDADGDGYVDLVYIVYAGFGENWGDNPDYCLWPQSGTGNYGTYDGVQVNRYGINQELAGSEAQQYDNGMHYLNGIGVLAHEFCHTMGLFDVYPTADWSDITWYDNQSMEIWSLMDYGENNYNGYYPTPLTAWERELFGWITIDELDEPADVTLEPLQDGGKAYKIVNGNDGSGREYYILESIPNGAGTGFYARMRGNGMVVTHVNYDAAYFSNFAAPNNTPGEPRLTILPADGVLMTSYRTSLDEDDPLYITSSEYFADHAGDPYPGTTGMAALTDYKAYTGTIDKPLTDISQEGWTVTLKFDGGAPPVDGIDGVNVPRRNDGTAYDLSGRRAGKEYRGIVVTKGKKTLQKAAE